MGSVDLEGRSTLYDVRDLSVKAYGWTEREMQFFNFVLRVGPTYRVVASASEDEEQMQNTRYWTFLKTSIQ